MRPVAAALWEHASPNKSRKLIFMGPFLCQFLRILTGIGFDEAGCCGSLGACFAQQDPTAIFHGAFP
jgi:hypothetical protein